MNKLDEVTKNYYLSLVEYANITFKEWIDYLKEKNKIYQDNDIDSLISKLEKIQKVLNE